MECSFCGSGLDSEEEAAELLHRVHCLDLHPLEYLTGRDGYTPPASSTQPPDPTETDQQALPFRPETTPLQEKEEPASAPRSRWDDSPPRPCSPAKTAQQTSSSQPETTPPQPKEEPAPAEPTQTPESPSTAAASPDVVQLSSGSEKSLSPESAPDAKEEKKADDSGARRRKKERRSRWEDGSPRPSSSSSRRSQSKEAGEGRRSREAQKDRERPRRPSVWEEQVEKLVQSYAHPAAVATFARGGGAKHSLSAIKWRAQQRAREDPFTLACLPAKAPRCQHNMVICGTFPSCVGRNCPLRHPPCVLGDGNADCLVLKTCAFEHSQYEKPCDDCPGRKDTAPLVGLATACGHRLKAAHDPFVPFSINRAGIRLVCYACETAARQFIGQIN